MAFSLLLSYFNKFRKVIFLFPVLLFVVFNLQRQKCSLFSITNPILSASIPGFILFSTNSKTGKNHCSILKIWASLFIPDLLFFSKYWFLVEIYSKMCKKEYLWFSSSTVYPYPKFWIWKKVDENLCFFYGKCR